MSRRDRDPLETVFNVLVWAGFGVLGIALFAFLADHAVMAAAWAMLSTGAVLWFGGLYAARVNSERLRTLADERDRRAVEGRAGRSAAEVIESCRFGRRIGDAERDVIVGALHTHFTAGRLDPAELDERLAVALAARTVEGLIQAVEGLPDERTGR